MSKIATIRHTNLTIKGVKKSNTRAIEVIVAGELDVKVGNKQLVFDYEAPLKMPSGALNRLESGRRDTGIRGTSDGPNGLF